MGDTGVEVKDIPISLPELKQWNAKKVYDYSENILSVEDLEQINERLNKTRIALFKVMDLINNYDRRANKAKTEYDRQWRRSYISAEERTEKQRVERANLECELFENEVILNQQIVQELRRFSDTLKAEVGVLQTVSSNLREQARI